MVDRLSKMGESGNAVQNQPKVRQENSTTPTNEWSLSAAREKRAARKRRNAKPGAENGEEVKKPVWKTVTLSTTKRSAQ